MDEFDKKILQLLQEDGRMSNKLLAQEVSLSQAPCWRRVDNLQKKGIIKGYTALLDQSKLGLTITAFAQVMLENHHPESLEIFSRSIMDLPEVLECHATSGAYDYLLKIVAIDMQHYNTFIDEKILRIPSIRSVNSSFSMMQKKQTTVLPLD